MSETTNQTNDLLPCPFCGMAPTVTKRMDEDLWSHNIVEYTQVGCNECAIEFSWPPGAELSAIEQWNRRYIAGTAAPSSSPPSPSPADAGVREALEKAKAALRSVHGSGLHGGGKDLDFSAELAAIDAALSTISPPQTGEREALTEAELHTLMRDPRYWRDRDPAIVAKVTEGFRRVHAVQPEQPGWRPMDDAAKGDGKDFKYVDLLAYLIDNPAIRWRIPDAYWNAQYDCWYVSSPIYGQDDAPILGTCEPIAYMQVDLPLQPAHTERQLSDLRMRPIGQVDADDFPAVAPDVRVIAADLAWARTATDGRTTDAMVDEIHGGQSLTDSEIEHMLGDCGRPDCAVCSGARAGDAEQPADALALARELAEALGCLRRAVTIYGLSHPSGDAFEPEEIGMAADAALTKARAAGLIGDATASEGWQHADR